MFTAVASAAHFGHDKQTDVLIKADRKDCGWEKDDAVQLVDLLSQRNIWKMLSMPVKMSVTLSPLWLCIERWIVKNLENEATFPEF